MKKFYSLLFISFSFLSITFTAGAQTNHLVISQVYTGGGTAGATYNADFIELYNPTASPISISGWAVQAVNKNSNNWDVVNLPSVSIAAGSYFLVTGPVGTSGSSLPASDATFPSNITYNVKVVLTKTTSKITGSGSCPIGAASLVDFVGSGNSTCYEGSGAAPLANNIKSNTRKNSGSMDYNDNATDFALATPAPHNATSTSTTTTTSSANSRVITTLPVHLTHFFVQGNGNNKAIINWRVNEELNFHHYEVEYSINGKDFLSKVVVLPMEGNGTKNYQSGVALTENISKHFFRLKMVDADGTIKYSPVAVLETATVVKESLFNIKVNPARSETAIGFSAGTDGAAVVELVSPVGSVLSRTEVASVKATPLVWVSNLDRYAKGLYYVRVIRSNTEVQTQKLVLQ